MTNKENGFLNKDWFYLSLLTAIVILFCNRILFTDQIIRASDVITQFFWGAKGVKDQSLLAYLQAFPGIFHADWDTLSDGGRTLEGGWNAIGLLFHRYLIQHFFPFPSSIAWLAVLAMCWGAAGTFKYSRLIGIGRLGAFTAGLIYVLCTENVSLINAGHIQKLEAICWFPWVIFFLEKAVTGGRLYHYALAGLMLALQFFHMHWQISFYSCLAVAAYCCFHSGAGFLDLKSAYARHFGKDLAMAAVMVLIFFSVIAMSFAPLYSWSRQSERGDAVGGSAAAGSPATPGAQAGASGIGYEEGMSWSLPPEEILTFLVPGLFGFSRQEGGDVPAAGQTYYWGRMRFTQTGDYFGLLPWFLIPLPLLFRRDRYTWFFSFLLAATLVMALGKYTFVYRFMFEHLPAFSKFRVPKMILFLFGFGAAVLAGRGLDILVEGSPERRQLRAWMGWCAGLTALLGVILLGLYLGGDTIAETMGEFISAPTRYQSGSGLPDERYGFMLREGLIALGFALGYLAILAAWFKKLFPTRFLAPLLALLLLGDLWRVYDHFLVVTSAPQANKAKAKSEVVKFLEPRIDHYRMQPLGDENAHYYADFGFANLSAYVTISERRYKEFLDSFQLVSPMADLMNLKYIVMPAADYQSQQAALGAKYSLVFAAPGGSVVLENRNVLPKAWLVPSVALSPDPRQRVGIMSQDPDFNPGLVALVESPPPLELAPYRQLAGAGSARVESYGTNQIKVSAQASANCLLVLGEKYYKGWYATVDGKDAQIYPVDHVLRGVYLTPGKHTVQFDFDPLPFKIGKYITLASFVFFAGLFGREFWLRRKGRG
jgi:hypothetical protein